MFQIDYCDCGESMLDETGRCIKCGKYRGLPRELAEKIEAVKIAIKTFETAAIAWLNSRRF